MKLTNQPYHISMPARIVPALLLSTVFAACAQAQVAVLTQAANNARTGANQSETILTPANVNVATFGKLFTRDLDDDVNGQVLYVPSLNINGAVHNVILAYTSGNTNDSASSLFAFDADDPSSRTPLWRIKFTNAAEWTTATPVIDDTADIIYVLTKDNDDSGPTRLHAINLLNGTEMMGSPVTIAASVHGTGDGSSNGYVSFDTTHANDRAGLLLLNGIVYVAFAHNSDSFPYHGWVLSYQYNGSGFAQQSVFCTDPNGGLSGIWMAGMGLAADSSGYIYLTTGNGTFDANSGGSDYGMSILKLSTPNLTVADWFAPFDELGNSNNDGDLGSAGVLAIPGTDRLFTGAGKFGSGFLVDSSELGRFTPGGPDSIVQRIDNISDGSVGANPVCFDAGTVKYVYLWPYDGSLEQLQYNPTAGTFSPAGIYLQGSNPGGGGLLTVSANGNSAGILWAIANDGTMHAQDATDVTKPDLWNSNMNSSRDGLGANWHFQFPMVANGKVYVPGNRTIVAYGLLTSSSPPLHSYPDGLQMFSAPNDLSALTLAQAFPGLGTSPLAVWNAAENKYALTPTAPANAIAAGQGYWVRAVAALDLMGPAATIDITQPYSVALTAGWNMVGDPFPVAVNVSDLRSGSASSPQPASALISPTIYDYDTSTAKYEALASGATLAPYSGYWVFATISGTLLINAPSG